jgi:DNA invertase Pin-like site-specific DNA recombinase
MTKIMRSAPYFGLLDIDATGCENNRLQASRERVERRVARRIPRRVRDQIRRQHAEGSSVSQLAREYKLTRSQIRRCLGAPRGERPTTERGPTSP